MLSMAENTTTLSLKRKSSEASLDLPTSSSRRRKTDHEASKDRHKDVQLRKVASIQLSLTSDVDAGRSSKEAETQKQSQRDESGTQNWCLCNWKTKFEDCQRAQKAFQLLVANVETRRALQMWSCRTGRCEEIIVGLTEGPAGTKALCQRLARVQAAGKPNHHPGIIKLASEIERLEAIISCTRDQQNEAPVGAKAELRTLRRQGDSMYGLCENNDIQRFLVFKPIYQQFFADFESCRLQSVHCATLRSDLEQARTEQAAARDEIVKAIGNIVEAHHAQVPNESTISDQRSHVDRLRASKEMFATDQQCEMLLSQIQGAEDELCESENRMYEDAEAFLVLQGLTLPRAQDTRHPADDPITEIAVIAELPSTPMGGNSRTHEPKDFAKRLTKSLKQELKRQYDSSHRHLKACEERLESFRDVEDLSPAECALARLPDHALFLAKTQRTKDLIEAEESYNDIRRNAQEAEDAEIPAKSTEFSSHASDGYSAATIKAHVARKDLGEIAKWVEIETSAKDKVVYTKGDAVEMEAPSEPGVKERPDLKPLELGESYSTIAAGKAKARIDAWLAVKKPQWVNERDISRVQDGG